MQLAYVAKRPEALEEVRPVFASHGHVEGVDPELVVVIGGDGTLLRAEREHPGVLKALLRDSEVGHLYTCTSPVELARALAQGAYAVEERDALEASVHGVVLRGVNDVIVRNTLLTHAIRFTVTVDGEARDGTLIGDGVVVATPLGSSAYYQSITRMTFAAGIGLAYNNLVLQPCEHEVLPASSELIVHIRRGPAALGVDNSLHTESLQAGDVVRICKSATPLRVVRL